MHEHAHRGRSNSCAPGRGRWRSRSDSPAIALLAFAGTAYVLGPGRAAPPYLGGALALRAQDGTWAMLRPSAGRVRGLHQARRPGDHRVGPGRVRARADKSSSRYGPTTNSTATSSGGIQRRGRPMPRCLRNLCPHRRARRDGRESAASSPSHADSRCLRCPRCMRASPTASAGGADRRSAISTSRPMPIRCYRHQLGNGARYDLGGVAVDRSRMYPLAIPCSSPAFLSVLNWRASASC